MRYFTFLFFSFRQGLWNLVCILPLQHIMIELPVFHSLSSACGWWLPRGTMQLYRMNFGHKGASPSFSVSPPGFYSRGNSPQFLSSHFWLLNPSLWRLWSPLMGTREANTEQPRRREPLERKREGPQPGAGSLPTAPGLFSAFRRVCSFPGLELASAAHWETEEHSKRSQPLKDPHRVLKSFFLKSEENKPNYKAGMHSSRYRTLNCLN